MVDNKIENNNYMICDGCRCIYNVTDDDIVATNDCYVKYEAICPSCGKGNSKVSIVVTVTKEVQYGRK